jgi:hypothetical protein
LSINF